MTRDEHLLMMSLMAGQYNLTMALFEMLKRFEPADDSDLQPFSEYVLKDLPRFRDWYLEQARKNHVHTGL